MSRKSRKLTQLKLTNMNKLPTTKQVNYHTLRNVQKIDKFQELIHDFDSPQLLTCIKDHVGASRTVLQGKTIGISFSPKIFKKGDIYPRNEIALKPRYWTI
jgi:hypothetical protein